MLLFLYESPLAQAVTTLQLSIVAHTRLLGIHLDTFEEMAAKNFVVGVIMALMGLGLFGCGCDTEEANKCLQTKIASLGTNVCGGSGEAIKCLKDNDCCDDEETKKAFDVYKNPPFSCTDMPSC